MIKIPANYTTMSKQAKLNWYMSEKQDLQSKIEHYHTFDMLEIVAMYQREMDNLTNFFYSRDYPQKDDAGSGIEKMQAEKDAAKKEKQKKKDTEWPIWARIIVGIPMTITLSAFVTYLLMALFGEFGVLAGGLFFIMTLAKIFFPHAMRDRRKD